MILVQHFIFLIYYPGDFSEKKKRKGREGEGREEKEKKGGGEGREEKGREKREGKSTTQKSEIKMHLFASSIPGNRCLTNQLMPLVWLLDRKTASFHS